MKNILLLSAGRRVELLQAFRSEAQKLDPRIKVMAMDSRPDLSAACQVADLAVKAPSIHSENYADFLLETCLEHDVELVIPTIDTELVTLATNRQRFIDRGVTLVISDERFVVECRDKRKTAHIFKTLGIRTPKVFARESIKFPCFAKPYDGSSGKGSTVLRDSSALSPGILSDETIMFMEFIDSPYTEFTVDAYYDKSKRLRCFVPRQRMEVRGGEVSKGVTRKGGVYDFLLTRLPRLSNAVGCITVQLFVSESKDDFVAIEINPRFGGGFPLSYSAGANYPGWLIREFLLHEEIPFFDDWEENLLMLRYDAKVLVHGAV